MSFVSLSKLKEKYTAGLMKDNIENLEEFDAFHCLLSGSMSSSLKVQELFGTTSQQFMDWIKVCDGGLLFDTVMLSTKEYDKDLELEFDTYEEFNSDEAKKEFSLPEGYTVFAFRSYGDPICFNTQKNDGKVYLWNVEKQEFDDIWDSFEDWLTEEIDEAVSLIADGSLEPLGIKIGGEDDE